MSTLAVFNRVCKLGYGTYFYGIYFIGTYFYKAK